MKSRFACAVLGLALLWPAHAVSQGVPDQQSAANPKPEAAAPNAGGPPACRAAAVVTFHPASADLTSPAHFEVAPSKLEVNYPEADGAKWAVCWTLVVSGADPSPFSFVKLDGVDTLRGDQGKRVLFGDTNFQGRQSAFVIFNARPNWNNSDSVSIKYSVVAQLASGVPVELDPEIIIKKGG